MKKVAGRKPAVLHQPHVLASDDAVGFDGGDLIEDEFVLPPKPTENLDGGDVLATRPSPPRSCVAPARACGADPSAGGGDVATLSSSLCGNSSSAMGSISPHSKTKEEDKTLKSNMRLFWLSLVLAYE
ncbi:hypothetical protein B296_00054332 [Ensete ventricosum]|uniref:Uncharacterized protein n=1 Tax=Ensete ventricosum TaxID=4639 RepID=A0A426Y4D3_ENSVE|nr:hypothetical protein B296_00054332 [Ensete ventricosum]